MADERPDDPTLPDAFYDALESFADETGGSTIPAPTPGRVAYNAYWSVREMPECRAWADLPHYQQFAWEAAAQAVLTLKTEEET